MKNKIRDQNLEEVFRAVILTMDKARDSLELINEKDIDNLLRIGEEDPEANPEFKNKKDTNTTKIKYEDGIKELETILKNPSNNSEILERKLLELYQGLLDEFNNLNTDIIKTSKTKENLFLSFSHLEDQLKGLRGFKEVLDLRKSQKSEVNFPDDPLDIFLKSTGNSTLFRKNALIRRKKPEGIIETNQKKEEDKSEDSPKASTSQQAQLETVDTKKKSTLFSRWGKKSKKPVITKVSIAQENDTALLAKHLQNIANELNPKNPEELAAKPIETENNFNQKLKLSVTLDVMKQLIRSTRGNDLSASAKLVPESDSKGLFDSHLDQIIDKSILDKFGDIIKKSGIAAEHSAVISDYCRSNKVVAIVRSVNPDAVDKMEKGAIGKDFDNKGKTSEFYPINAYVPFNTKLCKLATRDPDAERDKIAYFQSKNEELLKESQAKYESLKDNPSALYEFLEKDNVLFTKKTAEVEYQGRKQKLFFLEDRDGNPIWEKDMDPPRPIFLIQLENGDILRLVNNDGKTPRFDTFMKSAEDFKYFIAKNDINRALGSKLAEVEVISSRDFTFEFQKNDGKETIKGFKENEPNPSTADYDFFTIGTEREVLPFNRDGEMVLRKMVKGEEITEIIKKSELEECLKKEKEWKANPKGNVEDQDWYKAKQKLKEQILEYHKIEDGWRFDYEEDARLGNITQLQRIDRAYLSKATNKATTHGMESGNPFPEEIKESENFTAYTPNGEMFILNSEQEIIDFINEWREKGFAIDVPEKLGWQSDANGKLFIPDNKIDYRAVKSEIYNLGKQINQLKIAFEEKPNDGLKDKIIFMEERFSLENKIYEKHFEIMKAKNLPSLIHKKESREDELDSFSREICEEHQKFQLEKIAKLNQEFNDFKTSFSKFGVSLLEEHLNSEKTKAKSFVQSTSKEKGKERENFL